MVTIGPARTLAAGHGGADEAAATPLGQAARLPAALARSGLFSGGQLRGQEDAREVVRSGFAALDALLPAGGLRRGSLVEWLAGEMRDAAADALTTGAGAATLALAVACRLAGTASGPRTIVVVDRAGWFHPPAVMSWLGDARQLVVARPSHEDDEIWAIDQALRCHGVAAVVAWPRSMVRSQGGTGTPQSRHRGSATMRPTAQWLTAMRRWQLAARSSGAVGLLVRPAAAMAEPSWAEARLAVSPLPGGTLLQRRLRLVRVGGGWSGGLEGKAAETVLELSRGGEGAPPHHESARGDGRHDRRTGWFVEGEEGASCRAS